MTIKRHGFLTSASMILLAAIFAMPIVASAQGNGRGRGKPVEVFVNGHDARDGRTDRSAGQRRRRDRDDDWRRRNRNRNDDWRNGQAGDGYGNYGGSHNLRQTALNAGFNEGLKEGRRDRQRNEYMDWRDESKYQSGTTDYNSRLGDRELYRTYFRQAFENGYKDGYTGY